MSDTHNHCFLYVAVVGNQETSIVHLPAPRIGGIPRSYILHSYRLYPTLPTHSAPHYKPPFLHIAFGNISLEIFETTGRLLRGVFPTPSDCSLPASAFAISN